MFEWFYKVIGLFYLYEVKIIGSLKYRYIVYMYEKFKNRK